MCIVFEFVSYLDVDGGGEVVHRGIDLVLDLALASRVLRPQLLDVALLRKGSKLRLELGAERGLLLGDQLSAHVRPAGVVSGLNGDLGGAHVADLDLLWSTKARISYYAKAAVGKGRTKQQFTWDSTWVLTIGRIVLYLQRKTQRTHGFRYGV